MKTEVIDKIFKIVGCCIAGAIFIWISFGNQISKKIDEIIQEGRKTAYEQLKTQYILTLLSGKNIYPDSFYLKNIESPTDLEICFRASVKFHEFVIERCKQLQPSLDYGEFVREYNRLLILHEQCRDDEARYVQHGIGGLQVAKSEAVLIAAQAKFLNTDEDTLVSLFEAAASKPFPFSPQK